MSSIAARKNFADGLPTISAFTSQANYGEMEKLLIKQKSDQFHRNDDIKQQWRWRNAYFQGFCVGAHIQYQIRAFFVITPTEERKG